VKHKPEIHIMRRPDESVYRIYMQLGGVYFYVDTPEITDEKTIEFFKEFTKNVFKQEKE